MVIPFLQEWSAYSIPAGMEWLHSIPAIIFDLIMKVEDNYENDKFNYQNAIKAFKKQE